jgi:hypothetical protein
MFEKRAEELEKELEEADLEAARSNADLMASWEAC